MKPISEDDVHDFYKYYREKANILISTTIVFSSGVLAYFAAEKIGTSYEGWTKIIFFTFGLCALYLAIILGILGQFFFYKGYKLLAEWNYLHYLAEKEDDFAEKHRKEAYNKFWLPHIPIMKRGEKLVTSMTWIFLASITTLFIFSSLDFFGCLK